MCRQEFELPRKEASLSFEKRRATSTRGGATRQEPSGRKPTWTNQIVEGGSFAESGRGLGEIASNAAEVPARENALCGEGEVRGWGLWTPGSREGGEVED